MKRFFVVFAFAFALVSMIFAAPCYSRESIKIGALYSLTGGMSSIDTPSLRGAQLAVKTINDNGGLLDGRKLELISVDAKTDQKAAAIGAKKLLSKGVIAGIGHSDPAFVLPSAPLFQKKGIPFVTSGATLPTLPMMIGDCMFMVPFGDDDQSFAIADYSFKELGVRNVAIWTDNSMDFTKTLSKFYKQRARELGINIVLEDFFMMGDKDFSAQIARLKSISPKPDAIFISSIPNEAGLTTKQIRESGLTLPIVSGDGFDTELIVTVPGKNLANDVYFSTHTYREDPRPEVADFIEAYKKEYGVAPENAFAPLGYDAVALIADAITRAGSAKPDALKKNLSKTMGFKGVTGEISYTRPSGVPVKGVSIIGVRKGEYSVEEIWFPKTK
ncbi:MAG: ABC transporter substrate-binding protein [Desulfobacteraceae bacterium]|nr:ABC transporter substrate-binding protein [Desulfobacteraceae bacterium]